MSANNEKELKNIFELLTVNDFDCYREVYGRNIIEDKGIRIDYMCKAKEHLVKNGFTDGYFGIEVKHIVNNRKKWRRLLVQAITYSMAKYKINDELIRPDFILLFCNEDKFDLEYDTILASYFNVGIFKMTKNELAKNEYGLYTIKFSSSTYYNEKNGISNKNCALNRYCGTWT